MDQRMRIDRVLNVNDGPDSENRGWTSPHEEREAYGSRSVTLTYRGFPPRSQPYLQTSPPVSYVSPSYPDSISPLYSSQASPHAASTPSRSQGASSPTRTSPTSGRHSISKPSQPRAPRPKYSEEEDNFIWYHRIDLAMDWKNLSREFNDYFHDRARSGESGLQCRFYRVLESHDIPNIRSLNNNNDKERLAQFGFVKQKARAHRLDYPWMLEAHRDSDAGRRDVHQRAKYI